MFSRTLTEACPLASSSKIYIDITDNPQVCALHNVLSSCKCPNAKRTISFNCKSGDLKVPCGVFGLQQSHRAVQPLLSCSLLAAFQGEQFELSPATSLLSQAVVLGDRRTFSVYDLTQRITFGTVHSLNLLIRWKSSEGEQEMQPMVYLHQSQKELKGVNRNAPVGYIFLTTAFQISVSYV